MLLVELSKCGQAFLVLGNPVPCARFKCTLYSVSLDKWRQDAPKKGCQIVKVWTNGLVTPFVSVDSFVV